MLTTRHHDRLAASVYGDGEHHCQHCPARRTELVEASARQAAASEGSVTEGDLLCPACDKALSLTADARAAMLLTQPGPCDECGRHMAAPRGPTCSVCLAGHFSPGVSVPRAAGEGPRPVSGPTAEDLAVALETGGYPTTARTLRESTGDHRVGVLRQIALSLPGFALDAAVSR